jgi:hypothetical protein
MFNVGDRVKVIWVVLETDTRLGKTGMVKSIWRSTLTDRWLYYVSPDHWPDEPKYAYLPFYAEELECIDKVV